jgi:oxygen-independent coproporphyrinogen III oxidase
MQIATGLEPTWCWPRSVYVHVPFCAHRCGYCDFAALAGFDHLAARYLSALEKEVALSLERPQVVDHVFVGGGTPTRLESAHLRRLGEIVRRWFPLAPGGEWTVEANPGTLDEEKTEVLAEAGVNRISLGAQSFQAAALAVLERQHERSEVERAVELVRPRFPRWSLDLIFGVPGTTIEDWQNDLKVALLFEPSHLSCYGLVFEKGTPLWSAWQRGVVQPIEEELERTMYEATIERLTASGLEMYEISNFARPGHECRHNLVYWANDAYFGFGLGAARYIRGVRSINTRDLPAYLRRIEAGQSATGPVEQLSPEGRARETAILMLRRTRLGIERSDFAKRTGFALDELAGEAIARLKSRGWVDDDGTRVVLSRDGLFLADRVCCELL